MHQSRDREAAAAVAAIENPSKIQAHPINRMGPKLG
jgi:hypothetical protein